MTSTGPAFTPTTTPTDPTGPDNSPDQSDQSEELVKPSTTARTLRRLRIWLVVTSLAAGAMCLFVFSRAHAAVDTISNKSAPAVEQADAAYVDFADADAAAAHGLQTGIGTFSVLSADYQNELTAADQTLSELAADNVAGPDATSQLQLVQELVVGYNQQVEQAYADYAQNPDQPLAAADLSYSMSLAGNVLVDLKDLRDKEDAALKTQQSATWLAAIAYLIWIPLLIAAVVLVAVSHTLIRRRFRRRLNIRLAAAAVSLVAMGLLCGLSLRVSDGDLGAGLHGPVPIVTELADRQVATASNAACEDFLAQLGKIHSPGSCSASTTPAEAPPPQDTTGNEESAFASAAATADAAYIIRAIGVTALAVAAAALAAAGLRLRIDEYKLGT